MRPDKAKVVDEIWDDARIASFLDKPPMGAEPGEFSILLNAYRSMRVEDFARFIELYIDRGGDVNARNRQGNTLLEDIEGHGKAAPFREILAHHS
jgi:hypothetical protein